MKASDFRIGNKLLFNDYPAQGFRTLTGEDLAYMEKDPQWLQFFFQPIPLTEEWLLRFGFKNLNNNPYWLSLIHNGTGIHIGTNSNVELQFFLGDGTVKTKLKLNYVHQLQNLFFALTGEELTIKEV